MVYLCQLRLERCEAEDVARRRARAVHEGHHPRGGIRAHGRRSPCHLSSPALRLSVSLSHGFMLFLQVRRTRVERGIGGATPPQPSVEILGFRYCGVECRVCAAPPPRRHREIAGLHRRCVERASAAAASRTPLPPSAIPSAIPSVVVVAVITTASRACTTSSSPRVDCVGFVCADQAFQGGLEQRELLVVIAIGLGQIAGQTRADEFAQFGGYQFSRQRDCWRRGWERFGERGDEIDGIRELVLGRFGSWSVELEEVAQARRDLLNVQTPKVDRHLFLPSPEHH